jgi:hypothetical protein
VHPSGLALEAVGGNDWGKFFIDQKPLEVLDNKWMPGFLFSGSDTTIVFKPGPLANCNSIVLYQIGRGTHDGQLVYPSKEAEARATKDGWFIDQRPGNPKAGYIYGANGEADPEAGQIGSTNPLKDATLKDYPNLSYRRLPIPFKDVFKLETGAMCEAGWNAGAMYGSIEWGQTINKDGKVTLSQREFHARPTKNMLSALARWNLQAAGAMMKNAKNQEMARRPWMPANLPAQFPRIITKDYPFGKTPVFRDDLRPSLGPVQR